MMQCKHNFIIQVGQSPESYLHKRDLPYTNGSECIMIWIFRVWQTVALLTSWRYYSIAKQRNICYVHYAVLQNRMKQNTMTKNSTNNRRKWNEI